jgi:hypothetical protein
VCDGRLGLKNVVSQYGIYDSHFSSGLLMLVSETAKQIRCVD